MNTPAMTFDELVQRARALEPSTFEVNDVVTRVWTSPRRPRRRVRQPGWRAVAAVLVIAVGAPATALAVSSLTGPGQVAHSLPAGSFYLKGTEPTCTTVTAGSVYRCTLAERPRPYPGAASWTGTNEPTVDATKHVNGACLAQNAGGSVWVCYVGQAAVDHELILSRQQAYASQPWYVAHCTKPRASQTVFERRECTGNHLIYLGSHLPVAGVG